MIAYGRELLENALSTSFHKFLKGSALTFNQIRELHQRLSEFPEISLRSCVCFCHFYNKITVRSALWRIVNTALIKFFASKAPFKVPCQVKKPGISSLKARP